MNQRTIGSLHVSVVGLGCNNFGWFIDEPSTKKVVDAAIDAGVTFFDTADIYGKTKSEEFVGRVLKGRREKVILATKFGMAVDENKKGAKPDYVQRACDDSLRRLQMETIDLYQLHTPDPTTPIGDTLAALDKLVKAGKVREIGCSNFSAQQLREAEAAVKQGAARFVSVQNEYSLFKRDPESEVLPECEKMNIAFLPYFPLFNGLLTGKYRANSPPPTGTRMKEERFAKALTPENLATVERLIQFAESRGHTILELAFSWLLAHKLVASVIAGATKPEQIRSNAAAASWKLSPQDLSEVDRLLAT